jgi:hypothetical protein
MISDNIRNLMRWGVYVLFIAPIWADNVLPSLSFDDEPEEAPAPAVTAQAVTNTPVAPTVDETATVEEATTVSEALTVDKAPTGAETPTVVELTIPDIDLITVQEKGITFLKGLAEKEEADGLISPPVRQRKVIGKTMVDVRYSMKLVDVPVYKVVKEFRNVKVGDSTDAVMVRKKVNVRKKVGTKKEERKVLDPDGDIFGQRVKYEYGPGGPDNWRAFEFGYNAMAIYAMMRTGVDPQDEVVQQVAEQLLYIYDEYGMPDLTWDLAWSTAAFSMIENKKYQEMAEQMAGKLMDGQIDDGVAAGLWGPVCVNTELLAAMTQKKADYSSFYLAAKARYANNKHPSYEKKVEDALNALRTFSHLIKRVSMLTDKMQYVSKRIRLSDEMGMVPSIILPGLPSWIYNQRSADMESTAVAMFGLRVATERKVLPKETWRPLDERNRPLTSARKSSDVLQLAIDAIRGFQQREGWTELNQHQLVKDFNKIKGINGVPGDASSFKPLADPLTPLSTVQGYAIYSYYAAINGVAGLRPFARNVIAGNASVKSVLDNDFTEPKGKKGSFCELCFYVSETPDLGIPEYDLQAWPIISAYLAASQNEDGSWGLQKTAVKEPSSLRERRAVLPGILDEKDRNWAQAHVDYQTDSPKGIIRRQYYYSPKIVTTAYALLALANEAEGEK